MPNDRYLPHAPAPFDRRDHRMIDAPELPDGMDFIPFDKPPFIGKTTVARRVGISIRPVIEGDWPGLPEPIEYEADILFEIRGNDGNVMVEILPDGTVNFGPTYEPTEAAQRFWWGLKHVLDRAPIPAESMTNATDTSKKADPNAGESATQSPT